LLETDNRVVVLDTTTRTETNGMEINTCENSRRIIPFFEKMAKEVQPWPSILG